MSSYFNVFYQSVYHFFSLFSWTGTDTVRPDILLFCSRKHFQVCFLHLSVCSYCHTSPLQESEPKPCHRVKVDFSLSTDDDIYLPAHQPITWLFHTPEEEIRYRINGFFFLTESHYHLLTLENQKQLPHSSLLLCCPV